MAIKFTKETVIDYIDAELKAREATRDKEIAKQDEQAAANEKKRAVKIAEAAAKLRGLDFSLSDEQLVTSLSVEKLYIPGSYRYNRDQTIRVLEARSYNEQSELRHNAPNGGFSIEFLRKAKIAIGHLTEPTLSATDLKDLGLKGLIP